MPNSTAWSRIGLGVLVTIAIALIVVVAMSRPSSSEQGAPLLSATDDDPGNQRSVAKADSDASLDTGHPKVEKSPTPTPTDVAIESGQAAASASPTPEASHESDSESAKSPAADAMANDPPAAAARRDRTDMESTSKQQPKIEPDDARSETVDPGSRAAEALRRLSREFARRAAAARDPAKVQATPAAPPAHEIFPPKVVMSEAHRSTCLVYVGDPLPDGKLPAVSGDEVFLRAALGPRFTVVVFWNAVHPYALDQFEQLEKELVPFHNLGVETIAIHVGPPPDNYEQLCKQHGAGVLCLTDADKTYFARVSTGSVPRTYLLDAEGKTIWLDIEYSRTTRCDLRNALHYSLQDQASSRKVNRPAR